MAQQDFAMVRYADDFVVLCRSLEEAERALNVVRQWTAPAGLTLHPVKTRIVDARTEGLRLPGVTPSKVDNVGRGRKAWISSKQRFARKRNERTAQGLTTIIASLNPTLVGWVRLLPAQLPLLVPETSTAGSACGCEAFYANVCVYRVEAVAEIITVGPIATLPNMGCYCLTTAHRSDRQSSHR